MKALLLLFALCSGDEKKNVDVVCPVDNFKFTSIEITSTNDWGGVDRDFCHHAFKTRPMDFYVWVCPSCGYAHWRKDFAAKLDGDLAKKIREGLKPLVKLDKKMKQTEIPGYAKYDLLAQTERLRGSAPDAVGRAYLYAAWWHRQAGAVYLEDFDEWVRLYEEQHLNTPPLDMPKDKDNDKHKVNRTEYDLKIAKQIEKGIADAKWRGLNLVLAKYLAAYVYRKHGENVDALKYLEDLRKSQTDNSVVDDAVKKMIDSIEAERSFQKKAQAEFEASREAGKLGKKDLSELAYMLGEINRRMGEKDKAAGWYQKALDETADPDLKKIATEQLALVK